MSKIEGWFDGACEPTNPGGTMSAGIVLNGDGQTMCARGCVVQATEDASREESTNNVAEYTALWMLLLEIQKRGLDLEPVTIRGDSQLVINQMWGTWRMNGGAYIPTAMKCREWLKGRPNVKGEWVRREHNEHADRLSKEALEAVGITPKVRR